jgi:hypothetical protein
MKERKYDISHLHLMLFRGIEINLDKKFYSAVKTACKLLIETNTSDWIFEGYGCRIHKR